MYWDQIDQAPAVRDSFLLARVTISKHGQFDHQPDLNPGPFLGRCGSFARTRDLEINYI